MPLSSVPDELPDGPPPTDPASWQALNDAVVHEFRSNGGKVGGFLEGQDILVLTTVGARTGEPRVVALAHFSVAGRMFVVGSKGGTPNDPDWVHNLRANPQARAELGSTSFDVTSRELPENERVETYRHIAEMSPSFGEYQARTSRRIPVFELRRI